MYKIGFDNENKGYTAASKEACFMKRIMCILLSAVLIFLFAGCSNGILIKENTADKENSSLKAIDISEFGNASLVDYANFNNIIAILYTPFDPETQLDEEYDIKTYLTLYDIKKEKFKNTAEVNANSFDVELSDDYIQVWYDNNSSELYDFKLNDIGSGEGKSFDCYDIADTIKTIDTNRFVCRENYAYDSHYINYDVIVFYNDEENYYINECNKSGNEISGYEKIIFNYTQADDGEITLNVKNFDNKTLVNSVKLNGENNANVLDGIINSEYAIFQTLGIDDSTVSLYCWDYNQEALSTPFECITVKDCDFSEHIDAVCRRINENCGVNAELSKSFSDDVFYEKCIDNKTNAQYLLCLYDLEYCLSTFPKQLYDEMLCNDIENAVTKFKKLNIYIVGEIENREISAFASNLNDELFIVYSCTLFSYSTFCHELMHNMEYRIWNYESDFDEKWTALNPDDFSYTEEYINIDSEKKGYNEYFASDYGMKNLLEDRATVFEMYYDVQHSQSELWWQAYQPLNEKVNYLNEVLKKSFPSLSV